jgi:hypothetical protein
MCRRARILRMCILMQRRFAALRYFTPLAPDGFLAAIVRSLWIGRGDRACDRKERREAGKQDLVRARLDQNIDHLAALGGVLIARRVRADSNRNPKISYRNADANPIFVPNIF